MARWIVTSALLAAIAQTDGNTATKQITSLKIASYNIEHGARGAQAMREIVAALQREKLDIICLQEATVTETANGDPKGQIPMIAAAVGDFAWCVAKRQAYSGPAVLVRGKIIRQETLQPEKLPSYGVLAEVEIDGRRLIVVSVHMRSLSGASVKGVLATEQDRIAQAKHLVKRLSREQLPVLIAGDFNAMPLFPSYNVVVAAKYRDAALEFQNHAHTRKTRGLPARIDYLFLSESFEITRYDVLPIDFSDHRPIVAEVQLPAEE